MVSSVDGTRVVSGSHDGTVKIWAAVNGARVTDKIYAANDKVNSVALSLDGKSVVAGYSNSHDAPAPDPVPAAGGGGADGAAPAHAGGKEGGGTVLGHAALGHAAVGADGAAYAVNPTLVSHREPLQPSKQYNHINTQLYIKDLKNLQDVYTKYIVTLSAMN